jgi:hypothetical protein
MSSFDTHITVVAVLASVAGFDTNPSPNQRPAANASVGTTVEPLRSQRPGWNPAGVLQVRGA